MSKRLIAMLLTLMMVLGAMMVPAVAEDETAAVSVYETEIGFLTAIGVLTDSFDPAAQITKAQFAAMVANVLYPDVDFFKLTVAADAPNLYNDVTASHPYYSEIKACKDLKIINGDGGGNFNPDEGITVLTGITILINALGYKPYADINGGFPTGYYTERRSPETWLPSLCTTPCLPMPFALLLSSMERPASRSTAGKTYCPNIWASKNTMRLSRMTACAP